MSLSRRLVIALLATGLLPAVLVSTLAVSYVSDALTFSAYRRLDSIASEKAQRITDVLLMRGVVEGEGVRFSASDLAAIRTVLAPSEYDAAGTLETVLAIRQQDGSVRFVSDGQLDGSVTAEVGEGPSRETPLSMRALQGENGYVEEDEDYRGVPVIAVVRPLAVADFGLTVKIDEEEVLAPLEGLTHALAIFLAVVVAGILATAISIASSVTGPLRALGRSAGIIVRSGRGARSIGVRSDEIGRIADLLLTDVAELVERHALDHAVFESLGEGIVVTDAGGRVVRANAKAYEMLGLSEARMRGALFVDLVRAEDEKGRALTIAARPFSRALRGTQSVSRNVTYVTPHRRVAVALTVSPVIVDNERIGAVEVFRDRSEAVAVDRAKSEFVALASHQLRTPLSALRWYSEALLHPKGKMPKLSALQKEYVEALDSGASRMALLIQQLITMSRLESGTLRSERKRVDVRELLEEVIDSFQPFTEGRKLSVALKAPKRAVTLVSDARFIRIVAEALVSNALKYSYEGGKVTVKLTNSKESVTLTVEDHGYGIPESEQSRVFDKLYRAENAKRVDTDGTGLGLYIARGLVRQLGGELSFTSAQNQGSVFTAVFPKQTGSSTKRRDA